MKKIFIFMVFGLVFIPTLRAEYWEENVEKFRQLNPDGKKYDFVKHYIKSLYYLQKNVERMNSALQYADVHLQGAERVKEIIDQIVLENVNWRIARNMLKQYSSDENGLILKTTKLFNQMCDEQIGFNQKEIVLLEDLRQHRLTARDDGAFNKKKFVKEQYSIEIHRKESLGKMLEASLLIEKILISDQPDEYGELVKLAVTNNQRQYLLTEISSFKGEEYEGKLREGQTFLQASVAAIRGVLENETWDSIDG